MNINDILLQFVHEIANINPAIVQSAELIRNKPNDKQAIDYHASIICELTDIIFLHLTLVNIELNPIIYNKILPSHINLHGLFLRSSKLFKQKAKNKNVDFILLEENSITTIEALDIIKVIPYIIFDNCIKYAPSYTGIKVYFYQNNDTVNISITSMGPVLNDDEKGNLFSLGFRGTNAVETNQEGKGLGLYLLNKICKICNIDLEIHSEYEEFCFNNIPYSHFVVDMNFPCS